jgi:hypothetical protein
VTRQILYIFLLLAGIGLVARAQNGEPTAPPPACTAFGTTSGTCTQGNDARLGAGAVSGAIKANGSNTFSQAACGDLSNAATSCSTDATNASNISAGTLAAARLPAPTASTLGGIESIAATTSQWINAISTAGVPSQTQPAIGDISGWGTGVATLLGGASSGTGGPVGKTSPSISGTTLTGTTTVGHIVGSGTAPTCTVTGAGSTGSCTVTTDSSDTAGVIQITAGGTGITYMGTITLTFSAALGTHQAVCSFIPATGNGNWSLPLQLASVSSVTTSKEWYWANASTTNLTTGDIYAVEYICAGI